MMTSNVRLENLWRRLSLRGEAFVWHARLLECYAEPQRAYHTLQHLEECLLLLDAAKATGLIANPDLIEMALWFHDAVYDPQGHENEELSAEMALEALGGHPTAQEVARLILLTKSHQPGAGLDDAWIIDIDLAIFAQPMKRVLEYERQIRAEYAWVPQAVYAEKRAEILTGFLKREKIYLTAWARERYESQARANLRELERVVKSFTD
ncbi:N-methyl-D-aspartate receptor NMDAR2C subunit [Prosthecobacter sp.]|jgi:predicted metal-dependent HD superfamily phosphohydrolase|uniref:N-methyl-D-aspartate receptor NMDAR2C subunit n=1 Tax=Prosthecobacter sp. TaxID=1965333 RepID=UPI0037CA1577